MPALALTDRDGLYGAFKHVQACADAGIKPLLGADLALLPAETTTPERRTASKPSQAKSRSGQPGPPGRVTLLATGRQGWALAVPPGLRRPRLDGGGSDGSRAPRGRRRRSRGHPGADRGARGRPGRAARPGERRRPGGRRPPPRPGQAAPWTAGGTWSSTPSSRSSITWTTSPRSAPPGWPSSPATARTTAVLTNAVRYLDPVDSLAAQVLDAARHLVPLGSPRLVPHNGRAYLAGPDDMTDIAKRVASAMTGPGTASAATRLLGETDGARQPVRARPGLRPRASAPITCRRPRAPRTTSTRSCATAASTRSCTAATAPRAPRPPARHQPAQGRAATPATASSTSSTSSRRPAWPPTSSPWPTWRTGSGTPASAAPSGARARAASSTTCSASARSTRSSTTC